MGSSFHLHRDERGLTLTELGVTVMVMGIALAALSAMLLGFFNDVEIQLSLSDAERDTRPVIRELVVELRQSVPPTEAGTALPLAELDWDKVVFYSDRLPLDGTPEKHIYELINCSDGTDGGTCDLQRTVITADTDSVPPSFKYDNNTIDRQDIVLSRVLADPYLGTGPLFRGVEWAGSPAVRTEVASCDAASRCTFSLVVVDLRVDPSIKDNPGVYEIHEEVRLRNAPTS